jgi:hypothetical protein
MSATANGTQTQTEFEQFTTTIDTKGGYMSLRARLLAERIEEGASGLAAFAESLTDKEWNTSVSSTDRRTVGVIIHHVANMYPIEVDVARIVAKGTPVTDVTWEVVAGLNAKHAQENASVTKAAGWNCCAATAVKRPPLFAHSPIMNWTWPRPSLSRSAHQSPRSL